MTDKEWWIDDETYYLLKCGKLKDKLEIATKALQYYAEGTLGSSVARQALKEREEI